MNTATNSGPTSSAAAQSALLKNEVSTTGPATSKAVVAAPSAKKASAAKSAAKKIIINKVPAKGLVRPGARPATKPLLERLAKPNLKTTAKPVATQPVLKKAATRPLLTKTSASAKAEKLLKAEKVEKSKKPKLVRDSFTIPKAEYLVLEELKQRANKLTRPAKKSELLRAGIKALAALSDTAFLTALAQVPAIKTGRPSTEK